MIHNTYIYIYIYVYIYIYIYIPRPSAMTTLPATDALGGTTSAQSAVLGVEIRISHTQRYETRVENAIGAKPAQSEDFTSGNPDYVYRAIRNGNNK